MDAMNWIRLSPLPGNAGEARGPGSGARTDFAHNPASLDPKLVSAAHQFEASLMQELLEPLNAGSLFGDVAGPDGELGGSSALAGSGSALMNFGSEALAKGLSEKGGLGIARQVLDHFAEIAPAKARLPARVEKSLPEF